VGHDELGPAEHVDEVEGSGLVGGLAERPERRDAEHGTLVGIDRDALEALVDEVPEDAERRSRFRRRRADDRDPPRRPQDRRDLLVLGDRDRAAPFLEVEEGDRPPPGLAIGALRRVVGQVAPSLT
jgi:hypothetical protein